MPEKARFRLFDTATAVAVESPLAWSRQQTAVSKAVTAGPLVLRELAGLGHLTLRGEAIALDNALRAVLQLSLPAQPLSLTRSADGRSNAQWLSPDEWLLIVPGGEEHQVEQQLRDALGTAHYAIVNVSGGQTLLEICGEYARSLLKKSVVYDVDPDNFPPGKGVVTCFAKTTVNLRRPDAQRWELVVRRSFADYSWRWLLDAGAEYDIALAE